MGALLGERRRCHVACRSKHIRSTARARGRGTRVLLWRGQRATSVQSRAAGEGVMMSLTQQFRPHPEVVDTTLEEQEVVLLQLESMRYYSLNLTGTRIWQGLKQGLSLGEISRR